MSHSDGGMLRTLPKSKFPDTSQRPTLQAELSKDNGFRLAMLTTLTDNIKH